MTDIRDRLDALAGTGVEGIELRDPSLVVEHPRHRGRVLVAVLAAFLLVLGGVAWFAARDDIPVATVDDTPAGPSMPTWPDPLADPAAPASLPRLVVTAPGYSATNADEFVNDVSSGTVTDGSDSGPGYVRVFRRAGAPWDLIEVQTFPAVDGQAQDTCSGLRIRPVTVTAGCDFSGDDSRFEVGAGGVVADVEGLNVEPDEIRGFVDLLGADQLLSSGGPDGSAAAPAGWELVARGSSGHEFDPVQYADIYFQGAGGVRPELNLQSGTALTAYDELLSFALDNPDDDVTIHQVGDRVVAVAGSQDGPRLFWMEGDNVVAILQAERLTTDEALDLVRSLQVDEAAWQAALDDAAG